MNLMKSFQRKIVSLIIGSIAITGTIISCQSAEPAKAGAGSQKVISSKAATLPRIQKDSAISKTTPQQEVRKLVVYYFHGNARCPTCLKLENFAKSEIEANFSGEIKSGKLEWKTVNVEEKGNEHFSDDYKLYTKSVIVSTLVNTKETSWKNLDQIWQLVQKESTYREYIKKEVKACLEGKCL